MARSEDEPCRARFRIRIEAGDDRFAPGGDAHDNGPTTKRSDHKQEAATSPVNKSVGALVSGGLDSCVLVAWLARRFRRVCPVYAQLGLRWEPAELRALRAFLRVAELSRVDRLAVISLPVRDLYRGHWSLTGRGVPGCQTADDAVYLPGRNLLLLSAAALYCAERDIHRIALASLCRNPFADATPAFFRSFSATVQRGLGVRLRVLTPFWRQDKATVIRRARALPLHLTFSCLAPRRGRHCGRCNKCAERRRAFRAAGVTDRTVYAA